MTPQNILLEISFIHKFEEGLDCQRFVRSKCIHVPLPKRVYTGKSGKIAVGQSQASYLQYQNHNVCPRHDLRQCEEIDRV